MEEIFKERQVFKTKVIENVQTELNQFGLRIYNANVKELQDTAGSEYFKFLSRKAHEGASNQAKVDVANACMMGEIGVRILLDCISTISLSNKTHRFSRRIYIAFRAVSLLERLLLRDKANLKTL